MSSRRSTLARQWVNATLLTLASLACAAQITVVVTSTPLPKPSPGATAVLPPSGLPTAAPVIETPTPSATPVPTATAPPPSPTAAPTATASLCPDSIYYFPIQPSSSASYSQGHHDYPATDIFAPAGTPVVAVTRGRIDFVSYEDGWDPAVDDPASRGGLSVAVVGDDGVRYYGSHLAAIAPGLASGMPVCAGQVIGYVGNTGNARSVAPHLHFGISRPTFPEDWAVRRGQVDPFPYLQAWAKGQMVTPLLPSVSP